MGIAGNASPGTSAPKLWRVIAYEYSRHVLRRRFLFALLSVPAMIAVMAGVALLLIWLQTDDTPLGYVDQAGFLVDLRAARPDPPARPVPLLAFASETQARAALEAGEIQGYYVLEPGFRETNRARLIYLEEPNDSAQEQFQDLVRANLLAGQPAAVAERLAQGSHLVVRSADGRQEMTESTWFNLFTAFAVGLAFTIAIFTSSGYLMQAVVEEKENRTMEIMVTSVSPAQMMSGKILGMIGVGLTQLLVWFGLAALVVRLGRDIFPWMQALRLAPEMLGILLLAMLPGFILVAALMATVGATVTEEREGQQVTGLFTLPVVAPYWFTAQIMGSPNGPLATGLSFFPLTAPVTLTLRTSLTQVPTGQLALSLGLLAISAAAALWLAGRAFRLGMLRYGQRVSWRELFPYHHG